MTGVLEMTKREGYRSKPQACFQKALDKPHFAGAFNFMIVNDLR